MSSPQKTLETDVRQALKAGQRKRLQTLRLLLADLKNKSIELGRDVDTQEFYRLVQRAIKQRRESAEAFTKGARDDLVAEERREIDILAPYLPAQIDEDEIRRQITELIAEAGLEGPSGIGIVMKEMMSRLSGSADGATISRIAKQILLGG